MARDVFIKVRVTPIERDVLNKRAASEGVTLSDLIRTLLPRLPAQSGQPQPARPAS